MPATTFPEPVNRLARKLMASRREARVSVEPIRLKYVNLGDFGGTDPVLDSYLLEVKGPYEAMQALVPTLKKFKFRFDPRARAWSIMATLYTHSNRKRDNFWRAARRNQQAAHPILKKLVEQHNAEASKANKGTGGTMTPQELMKKIKHTERQRGRLAEYGLQVVFEWPDRFSVAEAKTWVFGDTYPVKDVMSRHGFRYGNGRKGKGWWMPTVEFALVGDKWANEVIKGMPDIPQPTGKAVFSDMSRSELLQFVKQVVPRDMEFNESYDGETSSAEVLRSYMDRLPKLKPHEQEEAMANWEAGRLPRPGRGRRAGLDRDLQVFQRQHPYYNDLDHIDLRRRTLIGKGRFDIDGRRAGLLARKGLVYIIEGPFGPELELTSHCHRSLNEGRDEFALL